MRVIITGGAGFLGKKLVSALLDRGYLMDGNGVKEEITKLVLFDIVPPQPAFAEDSRLEVITGDLTKTEVVDELLTEETGAIFHLAAIVSGQAERDFDLGMNVNMKATHTVLEACRRLPSPPLVVFSSSVAVFGGDMPTTIEDGTIRTPQSSYGIQKAIGDMFINDYSRKGFIDGRALRFPTIVVRGGKPNQAASTFASSIIRDPLQGDSVICPVSREAQMWILSPRQAIKSFIHAAELPAAKWGYDRALNLPGLCVSIGEMVDSLEKIAGKRVTERIIWQPDPFIQKLVNGWPIRFAPQRAEALGFKGDGSMGEIIQSFIDDELGGNYVK
ncbi:MAG: D-erythronate dehydrogenase [Ardenticatenaceae bacterium]